MSIRSTIKKNWRILLGVVSIFSLLGIGLGIGLTVTGIFLPFGVTLLGLISAAFLLFVLTLVPALIIGLLVMAVMRITHTKHTSVTELTPTLTPEKQTNPAPVPSQDLATQNTSTTPTNQVPQGTPSSNVYQTPHPSSPPKFDQKSSTLIKLTNFLEASDSVKNSENFSKVLSEFNREEKIFAIQWITSPEQRALFIHCMNDGASLEKLFSFLPEDISKEQKEEIKNAAWDTIDQNEAFFRQLVMSKEILGKRQDTFFSEREIIYNTIFLRELLKVFPERENHIIEKLFQCDPSFYNNILNYFYYHENQCFGFRKAYFSKRNQLFFTAILRLKELEHEVENSKQYEKESEIETEKNKSIEYLSSICKSLDFDKRPIVAKIISHVFPDTTEEKIVHLTKKLPKLNDTFQKFLDSGSIEKFSSDDIYYINNYFPEGNEGNVFYPRSEMEEKILNQIISEPKFFTHLIKNTSDLLHIINQLDDSKKNDFIKRIIHENSGMYFKSLMKNVIDLTILFDALKRNIPFYDKEKESEATSAIKNIVNTDPYFFHEDFFSGPECQFKKFSSESGYVVDVLYTRTINKPRVFSKFINDPHDLRVMMACLHRGKLFCAVKVLLSPEQSQRFKNCIQNGLQMESFYKNLYFLRGDEKEKADITHALWSIIDSDPNFFQKIMVMGKGSMDYRKKYDNKASTFNTVFLWGLLKIFPDHENEIFEKLFLSDLSLYKNVLGFCGCFRKDNHYAQGGLFAKHLPFIEGVVEFIALSHYLDIHDSDKKIAAMESLNTICKKVPSEEKSLFLKVINDIFPHATEEKTQILASLGECSSTSTSISASTSAVTPSVYTQQSKENPEAPQNSPAAENQKNKTRGF